MTDPADYLDATEETGAVAAADLMDRLTERLKAADGSAAKLKERRAAADTGRDRVDHDRSHSSNSSSHASRTFSGWSPIRRG